MTDRPPDQVNTILEAQGEENIQPFNFNVSIVPYYTDTCTYGHFELKRTLATKNVNLSKRI